MSSATLSSAQTARTAQWDAFRKHVLYPVSMHALMILGVAIVIFPLIYAFVLSTQTSSEYYQVGNLVPGTAMQENYETAWKQASLWRLMGNTMIVSLSVALGKIFLSITAAFALIYFRVKWRGPLLGLIMLTHLLPLPVRIVPTYQLLTDLGWIDTFQGLSVPFMASATGVLLFQQFYKTVPIDLADAARVDGAGPLRFMFSMLIPISRTNIGALFLIEFIYMWNQYLWPIVVANSLATRQVQIGIKLLIATDSVIQWGVLMAGTITVIIPPLIVLLLLQNTMMAGLNMPSER